MRSASSSSGARRAAGSAASCAVSAAASFCSAAAASKSSSSTRLLTYGRRIGEAVPRDGLSEGVLLLLGQASACSSTSRACEGRVADVSRTCRGRVAGVWWACGEREPRLREHPLLLGLQSLVGVEGVGRGRPRLGRLLLERVVHLRDELLHEALEAAVLAAQVR